MAVVRMFCRLVKGSTLLLLFVLAVIAFVLYAFYIWINVNTFSSITKSIYGNVGQQTNHKESKDPPTFVSLVSENDPTSRTHVTYNQLADDNEIYVIITFTKAKQNYALQEKFRVCVSSMLSKTKTHIVFYIIGDDSSQDIAKKTLHEVPKNDNFQIVLLDVNLLQDKLNQTIHKMQKYFTSQGDYYSDPLFFLSIAIHRVMPTDMHRVIMLDSDLKFQSDIKQLYLLFSEFKEDNIIGVARETQPVYRHGFWQYRKNHPGTRVGGPPPDGLTGFNSGVLLLDLDKMRRSQLYNSVIDSNVVTNLTEKYFFKGNLGDQDFFTLLSMEYENLFYVLSCTWNRQLCQWWRAHGYESVFDEYFKCEGYINIYHGNCNTPFPV